MIKRFLECTKPLPLWSRNASLLKWPCQPNQFSGSLKQIESKWKDIAFTLPEKEASGNKKYILSMFPYPSGNLHMGHMRVYTISDVLARYYRLQGFDVIHPMGWDGFGLPAENAAIERGIDSREWTESNIKSMKKQLANTGILFDWEREITTCHPNYFKWTQWIFIKLFEEGLATQKYSEVFWDPVDKTVLAAEQIDENGKSWRSGAIAVKKKLKQWSIETPKYAKRLSEGLEAMKHDWKEVADIQANWIGVCDVFRFQLPLCCGEESLKETLDLRIRNVMDIGKAKFVVLSKDHHLVKEYGNEHLTDTFVLKKIRAIHPLTGYKMPIIVSGEDDGLEQFLKCRIGDPLNQSVDADLLSKFDLNVDGDLNCTSTEEEILIKTGAYQTSRTLQDWVVSRQRKWGTPIPMLIDGANSKAIKPVPFDELPWVPNEEGTNMRDSNWSGETDTLDTFFDSSWYYLRYLDCGNSEALVSPQAATQMPVDVYVGGIEHAAVHMFFARFISYFLTDIGVTKVREPFKRLVCQGIVRGKTYVEKNTGEYLSKEKAEGLMESDRQNVEILFEKMSKSKHNGVDPLIVLERDGVDLTRLQLLDSAAPKSAINWNEQDPKGILKWLDRIAFVVGSYVEVRSSHIGNTLSACSSSEIELRENYNYYIRNVIVCLQELHLHNTAIARLQSFVNYLRKIEPEVGATSPEYERSIHALVIMLQVFAPHASQELWSALQGARTMNRDKWNFEKDVRYQKWPEIDDDALVDISVHAKGINCGRMLVGRQFMENSTEQQIFDKISKEWRDNLFVKIQRDGHQIHNISMTGEKGLCYTMDLSLGTSTTDKHIRDIMKELGADKYAEAKKAKKSKKPK
uniref:Leucine--tRNA ligase n=1 Tax=Rhabditophanes sp. KR3021 TaxID=114890 RepID=A0AC35TZI2_9BILA